MNTTLTGRHIALYTTLTEKKGILAPAELKRRHRRIDPADIKPGNALPLANIPLGTNIHNIELVPGKVDRWSGCRSSAH